MRAGREQEIVITHPICKLARASARRIVGLPRKLPALVEPRPQRSADLIGMIQVFPGECPRGLVAHDLAVLAAQPIASRRQLEIIDPRACCCEQRSRALDGCVRRIVCILPARRATYADAWSADMRPGEVGRRASRQNLQAERGVFGSARKYADSI